MDSFVTHLLQAKFPGKIDDISKLNVRGWRMRDVQLMAPGIHNEMNYSAEEINKAFELSDFSDKKVRELYWDHLDERASEWIGEVVNIRKGKIPGQILGDLIILDERAATHLAYGAKFGISPKVEGVEDGENLIDFLFRNWSVVHRPAVKTNWINNSEKEVTQVEEKELEALIDEETTEEKKEEVKEEVKAEEVKETPTDASSETTSETEVSADSEVTETPTDTPVDEKKPEDKKEVPVEASAELGEKKELSAEDMIKAIYEKLAGDKEEEPIEVKPKDEPEDEEEEEEMKFKGIEEMSDEELVSFIEWRQKFVKEHPDASSEEIKAAWEKFRASQMSEKAEVKEDGTVEKVMADMKKEIDDLKAKLENKPKKLNVKLGGKKAGDSKSADEVFMEYLQSR